MGINEILPGPYEILDLADGASIEMRVYGWKLGKMMITPKGASVQKEIDALRVIIDPAQKKLGPAYWDVTSMLLRQQLLEMFKAPSLTSYLFKITKHGVAPAARFEVNMRKA